ncbi:hypothetical protein VTP01DRAFT_6675 [Rhizomucor pusillus]|uniref:uncharacterized protein n=1 Tax=Rhizomucor pusillus TaxID=4840 RepID=UPI0037436992
MTRTISSFVRRRDGYSSTKQQTRPPVSSTSLEIYSKEPTITKRLFFGISLLEVIQAHYDPGRPVVGWMSLCLSNFYVDIHVLDVEKNPETSPP